MFKYKYTAIYWVIFTHQALYTKKSNSLHNYISHSTWLETFIHVRNLSLNFSFHASTKEIYYAHTHTHMHFNETHWTNIKIYRPQYTDFALYGHCGRYNSNSFLDVAERSPLHKLYIRTSFLHCCCVQCTLSKRALYDNHERKWVESNVIGNIKKWTACLHIKALIWDGKSMLFKFWAEFFIS